MNKLLRIIPPEHAANGLCRTQGTRVLTPNGEEVKGITTITLHCECNDVWRATLSVIIDPPEVSCVEGIITRIENADGVIDLRAHYA